MQIRVVTRTVGGRKRMVVTDGRGEALPNQRSVVIDQRGAAQVVSIALEMDGRDVSLEDTPLIQLPESACCCGTSKVCDAHEGGYLDGYNG